MVKQSPPNPKYQRYHWEQNHGIIPHAWEFITIGSLFRERNEKSSDTERYPLYSFTIEKGVTPKTERYERGFLLKNKDENEFAIVYPGDLVFNPMNLRFGAISFSRIKTAVAVSAYYNILIPKYNRIDPVFIEAFLRSSQALDLYNKIAIGSLLEKRRVHLSILEKTYIPLPPFAEQVRIGDILSTWNIIIEKIERLIELKLNIKHALTQKLLTGKNRLKGFQNAWHKYYMGDLFKERNEADYEHLPLLSITREEGVISREEVDRRDTSSEDKSNYLRICVGDIGYNTMRMWQGVSGFSSLEGIVSPAYTICTPNKKVDSEFMAYLFKLPETIHLFYRYSQGLTSDTWNLKFRHFKEIKVTIPEIEEQRAIAKVLKTCDEEIRLLRKKLEALKKQKRGLMQKIFTGKWRVKAAQEVT